MVSGKATIHLSCAVRHDYARAATEAKAEAASVVFTASGQPGLRLIGSQPLTLQDNTALATFTLAQDEGAEFVLGGQEDARVTNDCTDLYLERTLKFWRGWISQSNYRGRWREMVNRSALALKLLTYEPTRGDRGLTYLQPARGDRRPPQLGLPLHLDT